jgi:predicted phage terminase large subunit-like protein
VLEPSTPLSWNWHIERVCEHIQHLIEDHIKKKADPNYVMEYSNSVINVPPGTAKSRMLMVAAPAWAWENWPGLKFLCLSGNPSNVTRDAAFCRDLVQSNWYQETFRPDWELREDQNAVTRYTNTKGGERISKGITAKLTGDRGDCVAGETLIATELGDVPIEALHSMTSPPRVWSFNHETNECELRRIVASRRITRSGIVDVCTSAGNTLRCTNDHKIHGEKGYTKAACIAGCEVSVMRRRDEPSNREAYSVQQLLNSNPYMRNMRQGLSERGGRGSEAFKTRSEERSFLQYEMQEAVAQSQPDYIELRELREELSAALKKENKAYLFDSLSRQTGCKVSLSQDATRQSVRLLPCDDASKFQASAILQQDVPEPSALKANGRQGELTLQEGVEPIWSGLSDGSADSRTRRMAMYNMRSNTRRKSADGTPYKSQTGRQPIGKSDYAVRCMSYDTPQIEGTAVLSSDETSASRRGEKIAVYDIQVEKNHNFFAGGLLVHNCILLDDPNDVKEADSENIRKGINSDWDSSIYNRVNHYAAAVRMIIQQRVHEEDFSGHVLGKGNWVHFKLPLEYETKQLCECHSCKSGILGDYDERTEEGQVLHPDRFTDEVIEDLKITLGEEGYAGQCQQNPDPASGGKFKWTYWRFWKKDGDPDIGARPERCYSGGARILPEEFDDIIMSTDCAFRGKAKNDRVATFAIARKGADRFILDRDCDNMDFGETKDSIRHMSKRVPRAGAKLVEGKANGDAVVNDLRNEITGMIIRDPKGGKESRASILKPVVQAGNYYLPDGAPWLDDFCHEFARFPRGKFDDQIDAVSQAEAYFQEEVEDELFVAGSLYTR